MAMNDDKLVTIMQTNKALNDEFQRILAKHESITPGPTVKENQEDYIDHIGGTRSRMKN